MPEILLDSTHLNKFTHRRILKVDFSSDENLKTVEQLRSKAKSYIKSNNVGVPKTNLKINYQDLSKVEGVFDNPALEQIDLCDRLKVYYNELGILNENAKVVKIIWDVILEENHEIEVGDSRSSFTDSTSAKLESLQIQNDSVLARINALVAEQEAAFDRFFKEKSKVIEDKVKGGYEKALLSSEEKIRKMSEAFDEKINQFREQISTTVENYNRQFQAANLEISKNRVEATKQIQAVNLEISKSRIEATKQIQAANLEISKNRIEATKQIQALSDRVNNMQDISSNSTVVELKKLVNEAKETGKNINQKVIELEGNVTREFSSVKAKNENDLNVIRGEIKTGVDGLTSKISSLEEYKNQDGTRTESLKQWVQRDTASQLSRERTEINRVIDSKGFVKNTEFSSKFTENARGITNQLIALENYKNQDGVRTANLQIWVQNNTANQLTAERRSIEGWVDGKGYATTSVVENKVQETANSISREIRNIRESIPTSVGGRNYITDSDKLNAKPHWGSNKWDETVDGDTIILTKKGGSDNTGFWFNLTDLVKTQFQNETLTWSIDVKASRDMTLNTVGFETNGLRRVDISTQWKRISHAFINKFTNYYAFVFYHPTTNFNNGDKIYIRLPKLEIGNVATDWTPAPEDNNVFVKNTEFSNKFNENAQGINRQLTALEQYKNQDGSRTETLKQWVQRDTASQLSGERTEINRIIDNKGYVKNTEFSSKFNENARGINNQLSALETYKNQDGARIANMQIWVQNNTANQLTAARRSIESWVNEKGYATNSVVENKVQETANSISREIRNIRNSIPTSIGGRNYIPNSNFVKDMENWEMARLNNSGLNWQKGHAIYHFGRGLHIWGTPNGDYKGLGTVVFNLTAKQGEKLTLSMDLGKDALTAHSILFIGLHYVVDNDIVSQQWQQLDLATQNFEVRKYKRISKTFTVSADMNKCRLMIHAQNNKLINFYIDNIKLEKGDIATDWTPAPEDVEQNVNELNTWKQTTNQTLNTVTSTLNDTVRHAQLRIGADGIDFGSNKVFNGRNLASILSVSPESIKAITDRLIISPANENLVLPEFRDRAKSNSRDTWLTPKINVDGISIGDEYIFKGGIYPEIGTTTPHNINFILEYKSRQYGTNWITSRIISANGYSNERNYTLRVNVGITDIEYIRLGIQQETFQNYKALDIYNAQIYKKKSAELIVDGSIEGRQIKTETLETGHHKAGSITSEIIAANAVRAKHIFIDDGLINNLVTHNAFISKLWAQDAFIRSLKTVKISSTQLDTDWLSAYTGDIGGFRIGKNPNQPGDFWLTGSNNFNCGLNPGHNIGTRGAQIWAAWGNDWNRAGSNAWWVDGQGRMNCKNSATFYGGLHVYNARLDTHGQDIQGDANSTGSKTTVIWWSQINRVKSSVSDKRFKTNIRPTKVKAVDLLNKIEMVEFNWKKDNKFEKIGAIAQQVQSVEESLVVKDMDSKQTQSDYLRISYYETIPYLIKAVQELSEQNKELKNKLEEIING